MLKQILPQINKISLRAVNEGDEVTEPVPQAASHILLARPDMPGKVFLLDYRDLMEVHSIELSKTGEVSDDFNVYRALLPSQ